MPETWDDDRVTAIVRAMVHRKRGLFAAYPDVGLHDLEQEVHRRLIKSGAREKFNGQTAKLSTYVECIGGRELLDQSKMLSRRLRRDHMAASKTPEVQRFEHQPDSDDPGATPEDLAEWLGNIFRTIRRNFATYGIPLKLPKSKPGTIDRAQAAALLALKKHRHLSNRGAVLLLSARPDLLKAVGLDRPPGFMFFSRIERSIPAINFRPIAV